MVFVIVKDVSGFFKVEGRDGRNAPQQKIKKKKTPTNNKHSGVRAKRVRIMK